MLTFVGSINFAAAVLLALTPAWFARRYLHLPWLNPFTIAMAISLPVQLMKVFAGPLLLIEGGLFDPSYQFALLMGNLLVVAQTLGMVFFFKFFKLTRIERRVPFKSGVLSRSQLRTTARLLLLVFVLSFYLLASAELGLVKWVLNPREGYQFYRTGQGHWYAIATSALSASYLLYFLGNPRAGPILIRSGLFLALGYLLGSKFILLSFFAAALTFLWFIEWPHLKSLLLFGAPLVFGLAIWNLYLAVGEGFEFMTVVEYFDYYKNAADYYQAYLSGQIDLYYGQLTLSSFWAYVPRALWPDKPVVYGIIQISEIFYPGAAELTSTPAFGGGVEQFADFGVPGLLFFGFFGSQAVLPALLAYLVFMRPGVRLDSVTLSTVAIMLIQFAPGFGLYFPGLLYVALLAVTLLFAYRPRRSVSRSTRRSMSRSPARRDLPMPRLGAR